MQTGWKCESIFFRLILGYRFISPDKSQAYRVASVSMHASASGLSRHIGLSRGNGCQKRETALILCGQRLCWGNIRFQPSYPMFTGLKLENYYFFTFTFSRPEVRKLLLFYVFTFSRPEVRKLLLFYVFTFSRPEVRKLLLFYVFTFSRPEVRKLFRIYVFTFSRPARLQ